MQVTSNHETTKPQAPDLNSAPIWQVLINGKVVVTGLIRSEAEDAAGPFGHAATVSPKLTLAIVRAELRAIGVVITKTEWDEYRVNFRGGNEATAYYTNDIEDARDTGLDMMRRHMAVLVAGKVA